MSFFGGNFGDLLKWSIHVLRHLFQLSVTFHGGVKVLSYAWGSNNHIKAGKSTNAPDLAAIVDVATLMRVGRRACPSGLKCLCL